MTLRERMEAVYKNKRPDKPAFGIYTRYMKRGSVEREVRNLGMGVIDYVALTSQLGPPWHMIPEFISEVKDTEMSVKTYFEHGEYKTRRSFNTPIGELYAEVGRSVGDGSEHISKYYVTKPEDYKVLKYIVENTIFRKNEKVFKARQRDLGDDGVVLGRLDRNPYQKLLIELIGAERFLMDLYMEPEPVLEVLYAMEKRVEEQFAMVLESSAQLLWMPDNVTSDMTPPDCFRKYLLPYYQRYTKMAHEAGKIVIAHFDGKVKVLSDMINESGIDVIESVSNPDIGGDLSYADALKTFNSKVVIPNFPSNLSLQSEAEINAYIYEMKDIAEGKPFMLQVSEDLDTNSYLRVLPIIAKAMQ